MAYPLLAFLGGSFSQPQEHASSGTFCLWSFAMQVLGDGNFLLRRKLSRVGTRADKPRQRHRPLAVLEPWTRQGESGVKT